MLLYNYITKRAQKELDKIPDPPAKKIVKKIRVLEDNPHPPNSEKLEGIENYRLRIDSFNLDTYIVISYFERIEYMTELTQTEAKKKILSLLPKALDALDLEPTGEADVKECLRTVVETLYGAAGGRLWDETVSIATEIKPTGETTFPYGTFVSFVPDPGNQDKSRFSGNFLLTNSPSSPQIVGVLRVQGDVSPDGSHLVKDVSGRSSELNVKQLVTATAFLAMAQTQNLP